MVIARLKKKQLIGGFKMNREINLEMAKQALEQYAIDNKPTKKITNKEAVLALRSTIEDMLEKGFTYDDISAALEKGGLKLKGATIREYLKSPKKNKTAKRARNKISNVTSNEKTTTITEINTSKADKVNTESNRTSSAFPDDEFSEL